MRTGINLASAPRLNQRGFWALGSALALAAALFTGFVVYEGVTAWQQRTTTQTYLGELRGEIRALESEIRGLISDLENPATLDSLEQMQFLNRMIRQKSFSWGAFFQRVAASLPRRARLLSIAPSLREDGLVSVELQVGGRSPAAIHRFMQSLEEADHFSQVVLGSEDTRDDGPDRVVARLTTIYREGK